MGKIDALKSAAILLQRRIFRWKQRRQYVHVFDGSHRQSQFRKAHIHPPPDQLPVGASRTKLQRFWGFVGMGSRNAYRFDQRIGKRKYDIPGRHLPHEIIERVAGVAFIALRRP